ncbi:hypothetical protein M3689_17790 [Alkalihalophilus marmarensis]|uniref:hypothetical protein n=1 Tax=Alkalihalophilus marmarensis TaxID=521377 RepID=UPI0020420606|nr:hypothetical protein [Alkalihalophilus marmarensis]MCM3491155.1 hypothetical protein [Alkalihalophilus marmarensis]
MLKIEHLVEVREEPYMKRTVAIINLLTALLLTGCLNSGEPMVLLEEPIVQIDVSYPRGGVMNTGDDILYRYTDEAAIQSFRKIIEGTREQPVEVTTYPDYEIVVTYENDLPFHGVYVWLGEEGEGSVLTYLPNFEETYSTDANTTKRLRELVEGE